MGLDVDCGWARKRRALMRRYALGLVLLLYAGLGLACIPRVKSQPKRECRRWRGVRERDGKTPPLLTPETWKWAQTVARVKLHLCSHMPAGEREKGWRYRKVRRPPFR